MRFPLTSPLPRPFSPRALAAGLGSALWLLSAAAVALPTPAGWFGPPLLCTPIDIGDQTSLPWAIDSVSAKTTFGTSAILERTIAILEDSDDSLLDMETLRRATLALQSRAGSDEAGEHLRDLISREILDAESRGREKVSKVNSGLEAARGWMKLAYLNAALSEAGIESDGAAAFRQAERAVELAPYDGAIRFGASLVGCSRRVGLDRVAEHVEAAQLAAFSDPRLARCLDGAHGRHCSPTEYAALRASVSDVSAKTVDGHDAR